MNRKFSWPRLFGVALDASDDPWTLQLKLAAAYSEDNGTPDHCPDPYEAITPELIRLNPLIEAVGKLPIPSWLTPKPSPLDCHFVTKEDMGAFVAGDGMLELSRQVKTFVQNKIFPGQPIMVGVDHCATGGVVSALSEELGAENLTIIVLDQHFDALPLSLRLDSLLMTSLGIRIDNTGCLSDASNVDAYCCGNFWKHLIDEAIVLPQNLIFIGVADYPGEAMQGLNRFRQSYFDFEAKGCSFFPLPRFQGRYLESLKKFIRNKVSTPNVYVSLDLDAGAYRSVHAARYMDRIGMEKEAIMDVARIIRGYSMCGIFRLVGLDVMEFNVHFLGLETESGIKDDTCSVALHFICELFSGR